MRERLRRLSVRARLVLSLFLLILAFFLAWWAAGWAWPTRELAYRALETAHAFGPGEIVAQGEITFSDRFLPRDSQDVWMLARSGDAFAAATLEQAPGPLWRGGDPARYAFQPLAPTAEAPLAAVLLARADGLARLSGGVWLDDETEYLWAVCTLNPDIVRAEVAMNYTYHLYTDSGLGPSMVSDPVTVQAQPVAEGVWLARVRLPNPLEGHSGGYSPNCALRGYDATGKLVYDSGFR